MSPLGDLKTTGVSKETVENMLVDAGAVYLIPDADGPEDLEDPDNYERLAATRGGNTFTVEQEFREIEVDGIKGQWKGGKRIISVVPQITANVLEISTEVLKRAFPGADVDEEWPESTEATHDLITREGGLELADYIDYSCLVGNKHGTDEPVICYIENGLQDDNIELSTEDEDESVPALTFTGHYDPEEPEKEPWGILNPHAGASIIRTTSKIVEGQTDPDITVELSGDTFNSESDAEDDTNWDFSAGDTGLSIDEILYVDENTVVIDFDSTDGTDETADAGTLTIQALADALSGDE
ncbi:MAG: hypothetical protein ACOCVB_00765, partial [Bacillota bacterium]